jgi:hypothetical protein
VSLTGNDGITHYAAIDDIALAAGSIYALVDNLPGGTYQLTAATEATEASPPANPRRSRSPLLRKTTH